MVDWLISNVKNFLNNEFIKKHGLSILFAGIPFLTVLSGVLESSTPLYDYLATLNNVEVGISRILQNTGCVFEEEKNQNIGPEDPSYSSIWNLISKYSEIDLPQNKPTRIYRFMMNNSPYIIIPNNHGRAKKCVLIPDSMPIAVAYCTLELGDCDQSNLKIVGSISDLRSWEIKARESLKKWIETVIIALGFIAGVYLEVRKPKLPKEFTIKKLS